MTGQRKIKFGFVTLGALFLGFLVTCWLKGEGATYSTYATTVVGVAGLVIAGNAVEHMTAKAAKTSVDAPKTPVVS